MGRQSGLGRGLGAIIPPKQGGGASTPPSPSSESIGTPAEGGAGVAAAAGGVLQTPSPDVGFSDASLRDISVALIDPNPHQPREHFDHTGLEDLVTSIREHGVMQPIVVTPKTDGRFELIAGERRLRASKIAGKEKIPAIVRTATEQQKLELAIIENIQRQDLNPIEEAKAYLRLQNEFNLTQDEVGQKVGKSRPQVANIIRLLQLPQEIQDALVQGKISSSNARTLLSLPSDEERMSLFQAMLDGRFTVRQTEARVPHHRPRRASEADPNLLYLEKQLRDSLGVKVSIKRDPRGEGEIRLTFLNEEDLKGITKRILGET